MKLDVKGQVADQRSELRKGVLELIEELGRAPRLVVIQVGENPSSTTYVNNKGRNCTESACDFTHDQFAENITQEELIALIEAYNADDTVDGLLVQLPLPSHIDEEAVCHAIDPSKDVDGFHPVNVGKLHIGDKSGFVPCTAKGTMDIVEKVHGKNLSGMSAVVIGRSNIVGKPVAKLLMDANATVTTCHSRTGYHAMINAVNNADIIVVAVGQKWFLNENNGFNIRQEATIVDVGINVEMVDGKRRLFGDVHPNCHKESRNYTTVPGGVGVTTCYNVVYNTYLSAKRRVDKKG